MNRLLKIISIIMLVMVIIFQYTLVSNAAEESESEETKTVITLKTEATKISPNDEIKVYVYIESLKLTEGIMYAEGILEYDKDVLEPIITNGSTYNDWTIGWNQETGKLTADRISLVKENQPIAEITFKVKEDVSVDETNETEIKFNSIVVNDLDNQDTAEDTTLKLEFSSSTSDGEDNNQGNNEQGNNNGSGNNESGDNGSNGNGSNGSDSNGNGTNGNGASQNGSSGSDSSNEQQQTGGSGSNGSSDGSLDEEEVEEESSKSAKDLTQAKGTIPYTGLAEWIAVAVIAVVAVGFVSYKKYQKYKNV